MPAPQLSARSKWLIHIGFLPMPIFEASGKNPAMTRLWHGCMRSINKVIPTNRGQACGPAAGGRLVAELAFRRRSCAPFLGVPQWPVRPLSTAANRWAPVGPGARQGTSDRARPLFSFGFFAAAQHARRSYARVMALDARDPGRTVNKVVHKHGLHRRKNAVLATICNPKPPSLMKKHRQAREHART